MKYRITHILTILIALSAQSFGQQEAPPLDQQFLDSVLDAVKDSNSSPANEPKVDSVQPGDVLQDIELTLTEASKSLAVGNLGPATQNAQQRALELMQSLLQSSNQNDQSSQSSNSASQNTQQSSAAQKPSSNETPEQQDPEGNASGNSAGDQVGNSEEVQVRIAPRQILGNSVWGHLPTHVRQHIQSTSVEHVLPQYRDSVIDYFKRLSQNAEDR